MTPQSINDERFLKIIKQLSLMMTFMVFGVILLMLALFFNPDPRYWFKKSPEEIAFDIAFKEATAKRDSISKMENEIASFWKPTDMKTLKSDQATQEQIEYGKELIAHTSKYLGPKGSVSQSTNGMNCQNCHMDAGTKPWGNNYGAVYATYPKYRSRSGKEEDIFKRINDCFERSLNGKPLPNTSKEILAMKAYIEYIGSDVKKGTKPKATGIYELTALNRKLDPEKGKVLFELKCQSCHQADGQGIFAANQTEYTYPPLWGKNSYNIGAGLFRMSRFAGYIKYNMPQGASFQNPLLTDEECWDLAAFVNSQARPIKDLSSDWPKISEKPFDHPFGPFADQFSEEQHKLGPFAPIISEKKKLSKNKI